jgi:hypothetical protein
MFEIVVILNNRNVRTITISFLTNNNMVVIITVPNNKILFRSHISIFVLKIEDILYS